MGNKQRDQLESGMEHLKKDLRRYLFGMKTMFRMFGMKIEFIFSSRFVQFYTSPLLFTYEVLRYLLAGMG